MTDDNQQQIILTLKGECLVAVQRRLRCLSTGHLSDHLIRLARILVERQQLDHSSDQISKRKELLEKRKFYEQDKRVDEAIDLAID
jgi:hypothetical protein